VSGVHVEVNALSRVFHKGGKVVDVLRDVNLSLQPGERVALVGPSGSGKSTFMYQLGLLDHPTSGSIAFDGEVVTRGAEAQRGRIRNQRIGFVFQSHNLLPDQSALANVALPVKLAGGSAAVAADRAFALLTAVGLGHRLTHQPGELSGGEQQRVAIARALVMGPGLVLADEPTGNLDPLTADTVFDLFLRLSEQLGSTLVVVTHSMEIASRFGRVLRVVDGHVVESGAGR